MANATKQSNAAIMMGRRLAWGNAVEVTVALTGDIIDRIMIVEDTFHEEDSEGFRYAIEAEESGHTNETDDLDEARYMVADMARGIRNEAIDTRAEQAADDARDFVESLIERGMADGVLKALRAAKLI